MQVAITKISDRLPWLVDQLMILAEGVEIRGTDRHGQLRVYTQAPDRAAIEYLIDRVMGKPTQPVDMLATVRLMAAQAGLSDEETAAAVTEAERYLKELKSGVAR